MFHNGILPVPMPTLSPHPHTPVVTIQTKPGLICEQHGAPLVQSPTDVFLGKLQPVPTVRCGQNRARCRSSGMQSRLVEPVAHGLYRQTNSCDVPELVTQSPCSKKWLSGNQIVKMAVLSGHSCPAATSSMSPGVLSILSEPPNHSVNHTGTHTKGSTYLLIRPAILAHLDTSRNLHLCQMPPHTRTNTNKEQK